MALAKYDSSLVYDQALGRGLPGRPVEVTDPDTGIPVENIQALDGTPVEKLLSNSQGYVPAFQVPDGPPVVRIRVGSIAYLLIDLTVTGEVRAAAVRLVALEQKNVTQDANISHVSDRLTGVESMAGIGPSTPVDGQTANLIEQPDTLTKAALSAVIVQRTFLIDQDYASLEDALLALAPGGVMEVRGQHSRASTWNIDKSCLIRFTHRGSITVTVPSIAAITVAASDVTLDRPKLTGTGGSVAGAGDGIRAVGTAVTPITGLRILVPKITGFSKHGIYAEHIHDFKIQDKDIRDCAYAGIMLLSAINGTVSRGIIKNIVQPTGFVNSYGVAITRNSNGSITNTAPRSRDVVVEFVTVDGVPKWEGLDTHAGENITFRGNNVYNCQTGIAIIGSKDESGTGTAYAPINCRAIDNNLDSKKTDGSAQVGIVFAGAADTLDAPTQLATGVIDGNIVSNYGAQGATGAAVQLYGTAGVPVSNNVLINAGFSGIDFYHDNYGTKASGNTIVDVWSDSASTCYAVLLRSSSNKITISGTTIVRAGKVAAKVNDRGLSITFFTSNVVVDGGGNGWNSASSLATVGDTNTTEMRNYAKKVGLYGVTPVGQASAISSPVADLAALKTAVDAIRAALTGVGITK